MVEDGVGLGDVIGTTAKDISKGIVKVLVAQQDILSAKVMAKLINFKSNRSFDFKIVGSLEAAEEQLEDHHLVMCGLGNGTWGDAYNFIRYASNKYPVIVMTGWGEIKRSEAYTHGAVGFIPVDGSMIDVFPKTVEAVLDNGYDPEYQQWLARH